MNLFCCFFRAVRVCSAVQRFCHFASEILCLRSQVSILMPFFFPRGCVCAVHMQRLAVRMCAETNRLNLFVGVRGAERRSFLSGKYANVLTNFGSNSQVFQNRFFFFFFLVTFWSLSRSTRLVLTARNCGKISEIADESGLRSRVNHRTKQGSRLMGP